MTTVAKMMLGLLLVFAGVVLFLLWAFGWGIPVAVTNEIKARQCSGVITGIYKEQPGFIKITVKEKDTAVDLTVNSSCSSGFDDFFKFIEVGDSITKVKGEMRLKVSKQQQQKQTKEFDYPFCLR